MIVCKAMNARNKAGNQDNEKMNYEKEMEKCLNSIFRNLRALEEIRRVRVPQRCEEVKKERNAGTETSNNATYGASSPGTSYNSS